MSADKFTIRESRRDEQSTLVTFLLQYLIPRMEPIATYFKINEHKIDEAEKQIITESRKEFYMNELSKYFCHVVIHNESKNIIGFSMIQQMKNPRSKDKRESYTDLEKPPMKSKILNDYMNDVINPLYEYAHSFAGFSDLQEAFYLAVVCVHPSYGSYGISTRLIREAVRYAESKNGELLYGLVTSPFTRKAAEKDGFQCISKFDLLTLRDGDGNVIFKDTEPCLVTVMAKRLQ